MNFTARKATAVSFRSEDHLRQTAWICEVIKFTARNATAVSFRSEDHLRQKAWTCEVMKFTARKAIVEQHSLLNIYVFLFDTCRRPHECGNCITELTNARTHTNLSVWHKYLHHVDARCDK
jgi:hypothetical protein